MAAPSWRCLPPEDGDVDGSFGQQNGGTIQEERGLSFLLKQEDREIQDSYLHLFNKLDVAVKEMKQYVIQINKWVKNLVHTAESKSDKMEALTWEHRCAYRPQLSYSPIHTCACITYSYADPPMYILLSFAPKSLPEFNSHCFAYYIFHYKKLFCASSGLGIP